jgi:hypothetical protein
VWILCLKTLPKPLRICFLLSLPTPLRHKNKWNPKNQWTGLGSTGERNREKMAAAAALPLLLLGLAAALLAGRPARATDPSVFLDWDVSYITASPLGVPQKVRFFFPSPASSFEPVAGAAYACVEQDATDEHTNQAPRPEIPIVSASLPSRFEI